MAIFTYRASDVTQKKAPKTLKAAFGDGYEQAVGDGINTNLKTFDLVFENLPKPEGDLIDTFLNARAAYDAFQWTPPYGVQGWYRCASWERQWDREQPGVSSITATFYEVPST